MTHASYQRADFYRAPYVAFYELTQACDLACQHCRACAQPRSAPGELTPQQSRALLTDLARFEPTPIVVLTGGDPLKRDDLGSLIAFGTELGLEVSLTPSATPLLTRSALTGLAAAGLRRVAFSLDGATARTHDAVRGLPGAFATTLGAIDDARHLGIPVQINTTLTRQNLPELGALAELLAGAGIVLWSVFFLVPTGRALPEQRLLPEQYEQAFALLWQQSLRQPYAVKTTEAPHYRRFVMEATGAGLGRAHLGAAATADLAPVPRAPLGTNDGKGVLFVSHTGEIYPSGFLPAPAGQFPNDSVVDVYRQSPLFRALRDPEKLEGKCGRCEYRQSCGGSRARAFALTGNALAEEPDCLYEPRLGQVLPAKERPSRGPARHLPIT